MNWYLPVALVFGFFALYCSESPDGFPDSNAPNASRNCSKVVPVTVVRARAGTGLGASTLRE